MEDRKPIRWQILVFLAPAFLVYTAVMIIPLFATLNLALFRTVEGVQQFVGLDNFRTLFGDPRWSASFWNALGNNFWFFVIHMLVQNPIGVLLAAILSAPRLRGAVFYRTAIFVPTILSFVIVGFVWKLILSPIWGIAPGMLDAIGLKALYQPWLGKEGSALTALALVSVWQFVGIPMMLIYAALLSIPDEVIEAAEMDGITGWSQFWKIKLPMILPSIGIISILTFVGNFNAFDLVYVSQGALAGPELRHRHPRDLPLPDLLRLPAAARRPAHGRRDRHGDVRDHPGRRLGLPLRRPVPAAAVLSDGVAERAAGMERGRRDADRRDRRPDRLLAQDPLRLHPRRRALPARGRAGDFSATVDFRGDYETLYDQAGLMLRLDEETWIKAGIEYVAGRRMLSAVVTRDVSDWSTMPLPGDPAWVRLQADADRHRGACPLGRRPRPRDLSHAAARLVPGGRGAGRADVLLAATRRFPGRVPRLHARAAGAARGAMRCGRSRRPRVGGGSSP